MPKVLVIDDSRTTRMFYRETLEAAGFGVDEALNGLEGLEKTMERSFDLIVVDLNMPKMDGYTFLAQLRRSGDLQAVPAIMISTQARDADQIKAYAAGANVYIVKPVDAKELARHCLLMTGQAPSDRISA